MKKGFTSLHHPDFRSTGRHTRYFIMTITTGYLLATGMLLTFYAIGKNFFNW